MTRHDEHAAQVEVIRWMRSYGALRWPSAVLYAIPNAAQMSPRAGRWMAAEGRTAGMPDLCLATPNRTHGALYIEMKSPGGRLRTEQRIMAERLLAAGNAVVVCYSAAEAIREIEKYMEGK